MVRVTQPELMRTAQAAAIDTSAADTLVLVGQVAGDSSLIGPAGREMTLNDFAGQIRDLGCQYRRVLYRPHPKGRPAADPILGDLERDREPSIYAHMARGASFCAKPPAGRASGSSPAAGPLPRQQRSRHRLTHARAAVAGWDPHLPSAINMDRPRV